ncbi:MAG: adenosine kinase [Desulfobacterales bacterium]|jgi:sugar/nucleoside kinase (ribokinase family)|nr:adenosine kinase [Desulfobacterales bacterium]
MHTTGDTPYPRPETAAPGLLVGVGSALVDILAHEDDAFLNSVGALKGGMVYVAPEQIEQTLACSGGVPKVVPGGSACNTVVGVSRLGGRARFIGKRGNGAMGDYFEKALRAHNVEPRLFRSNTPTGRVLSIITPDAQRSMFTFLGAAAETRAEEIAEELFHGASIVHVEGYLLFNPELLRRALRLARAAGARVSLDLASFNVVQEARELLGEMVAEYVDILLANEDEARAYSGETEPLAALAALGRGVEIAVLKTGERGSLIKSDGRVIAVPAAGGEGPVVDTTGAGDLWASGFLYGLVSGYPLERCGELGSLCGYEVCKVVGASIPDEAWRRIRERVERLDNDRAR